MARRTRISLLSCVFALALAGCGSGDDGTIPPNDAENLLNQLAAVEQDVEEGRCDFAQQHAQEFVTSVGALPNEVDPEVEQELTSAASRLDELASDPSECDDTEEGATGELGEQPETSTTTTTAPETTTEETSTTETTTLEEEPEEQPSEDQNQEPPAGGDQGGGPGSGGAPPSGGVGAGGGAG